MNTETRKQIEECLQDFRSDDYAVQNTAVKRISKIGLPAVPALIKALNNENARVRENAAWALKKMGEKTVEAVPALIKALKDEDARVCENSVNALAIMGEKAVPALIKALKDENALARKNAARTLAKIGEKAVEAVPALINALKDENARAGIEAAQALANIGEKAVLFLVKAAERRENACIRQKIREIIRVIDNKARRRENSFGVRDETRIRENERTRFERTAFPARVHNGGEVRRVAGVRR